MRVFYAALCLFFPIFLFAGVNRLTEEITIIVSSPSYICANTTTSATALATGGTSPYAYSWNTNPVQTTATASNLSAGTYTVTVTDALGKVSTQNIIITSKPEPQVFPQNLTFLCGGGGSYYVPPFTGTNANYYSWTIQNPGTTSLPPSGTGNIPPFYSMIVGGPPQTIIINVTPIDTTGGVICSGVTVQFHITIMSNSFVNLEIPVGCEGSSTLIKAHMFPGDPYNKYTYSWSVPQGVANPGNVDSFRTSVDGIYSVFVVDQYGCSTSNSGNYTPIKKPTINSVSNQLLNTGQTVSLSFIGTNANSFTWTNSNPSIGLAAKGTGNISFVATNNGTSPISGNITVTPISSVNGTNCDGVPSSFNITVNPSLPITPLKIEAENYITMSGIQTEGTADAGGGLNVGWIQNGDWMDYSYTAATAGIYTVNLRVAVPYNGAQLQIKNSSGVVLQTVSLPTTGGYQLWQTVSTTVTLPAGVQTIRIQSSASEGWNFNWLEIVKEGNALRRSTEAQVQVSSKVTSLRIYPNPVFDRLFISLDNDYEGKMKIEIINMLGVLVKEVSILKAKGLYTTSLSAKELSKGSYFIKLSTDKGVQIKQLLKQ